jgi:hypothetical protein
MRARIYAHTLIHTYAYAHTLTHAHTHPHTHAHTTHACTQTRSPRCESSTGMDAVHAADELLTRQTESDRSLLKIFQVIVMSVMNGCPCV